MMMMMMIAAVYASTLNRYRKGADPRKHNTLINGHPRHDTPR